MNTSIKISIKSARVNKGLSQAEASKLLGVSTTTLINWERGKHNMPAEKARLMSEVYGISMNNLIF